MGGVRGFIWGIIVFGRVGIVARTRDKEALGRKDESDGRRVIVYWEEEI